MLTGSEPASHVPSRAISIEATSWPAASSPSRIAAPEASETSCSEERPPESTATVSESTREPPPSTARPPVIEPEGPRPADVAKSLIPG